MNNGSSITRRAAITAAALGASGLITPNKKAYGSEIIENGWVGPDLESLSIQVDDEHPILTPIEYINSVKARNEQFPDKVRLWQTCTLDESGNMVILKTHESVDESIEWMNAENIINSIESSGIDIAKMVPEYSGPRSASLSAAISVLGGVLLGYLFSVVVDGIVISATGESTAYWFAQAMNNTLRKALSPDRTTRINCGMYITNGAFYFNCLWGTPIN